MQRLISEHAEFAAYLLRSSMTRYMGHSLAEIRARTSLLGEGERLLYSISAREVARKPALTCGELATLQHAAQLMRAVDATSLSVSSMKQVLQSESLPIKTSQQKLSPVV